MVRTVIEHSLRAGFFLLCCSCCTVALAQYNPGDYNSDGDIDGDDFANWGFCMTGPDGNELDASCYPFDFDGYADVDLPDFGSFQAMFGQAAPDCGRPQPPKTRYYVGALMYGSGILGASAHIETRLPLKLCGEGDGVQDARDQVPALSAAWADVSWTDGVSDFRWAQVGYQRKRFIFGVLSEGVYAETRYGPKKTQTNLGFKPGPPPGPHGYRVEKDSFYSPEWIYYFDEVEFHRFPHAGWGKKTGVAREWHGELLNKKDDMVGRDPEPERCHFCCCTYKDAAGWHLESFDPVIGQDLKSDDESEWGIQFDFPPSFHIWDKTPN